MPGRIAAFALACLIGAGAQGNTEELKLPNLGEASTSLFSAEFEHQLGRAWLRSFRSQVPTQDDPLLFDYLENLIYNLVTHSKLEDRRAAFGATDCLAAFRFAGIPYEVAARSQKLFAEEVLPVIKAWGAEDAKTQAA